jgi:hypothetical protein
MYYHSNYVCVLYNTQKPEIKMDAIKMRYKQFQEILIYTISGTKNF